MTDNSRPASSAQSSRLASSAQVLVIGAGPAGLATAATLRRRGVPFRLLDRDARIGGAYARIEPELLMTSPARLVGLPGLAAKLPRPYASVRAYRDYLIAYAAAHDLVPEAGLVEQVASATGGYRTIVRRDDAVETITARAVVVASGVFDFPHRQPVAGTPTIPVIHSSEWRNALVRHGQRVVIAGGATSAVEIAELAAQRGCSVTLAARKLALGPATIAGIDLAYLVLPLFAHFSPHKFCELGSTVPAGDRGFKALRRSGAISVRPALTRLDGARATFADDTTADFDLAVLATGYRFACPFLPPDLARTPRGTPRCRNNESVSHPRLFVVGSPCARSAASQYLYGIARDAHALSTRVRL